MSNDKRPRQIGGVSTDADGTPGDPERRSNTLAPDHSGTRIEPDDTGVESPDADVREDVNVTGSDLTTGEEPHNPH